MLKKEVTMDKGIKTHTIIKHLPTYNQYKFLYTFPYKPTQSSK